MGVAAGVHELTDATFDQALKAPFAVVDFWSPSCPHCVQYKPIFEAVASQLGDKVFMGTLKLEDNPKSAGQHNINVIPATIFFANGKEVNRTEGDMSKEDLTGAINGLLGGRMQPSTGVAAEELIPGHAAIPSSIPTSTLLIGGASLAVIGGAIYLLATA